MGEKVASLEEKVADIEEQLVWYKDEVEAVTDIETVHDASVALDISPMLAKMTLRMLRSYPRMLTRDQLLEELGHGDDEFPSSIVSTYVCRLRKLVTYHGIDTIRGKGFRLSPLGAEIVRGLLETRRKVA